MKLPALLLLQKFGSKAGVWAPVSWLLGSFTRHIFWLIELSPGLNSGTVCYIKLSPGSRLRVVLWEEILPGYVLLSDLRYSVGNSTYYSGQDGPISEGELEEKRTRRHVSISAWRTLSGPRSKR